MEKIILSKELAALKRTTLYSDFDSFVVKYIFSVKEGNKSLIDDRKSLDMYIIHQIIEKLRLENDLNFEGVEFDKSESEISSFVEETWGLTRRLRVEKLIELMKVKSHQSKKFETLYDKIFFQEVKRRWVGKINQQNPERKKEIEKARELFSFLSENLNSMTEEERSDLKSKTYILRDIWGIFSSLVYSDGCERDLEIFRKFFSLE